MPGISDFVAAELSLAAYTPIGNYQNGGLSADEYLDAQGNVTALPVGWSVVVANSGFAGGNADSPTNQFLTFVNDQTMQVVIAFKGSDNLSNFYSDLFPPDEGASAYASIQPAVAAALARIESTYPNYTIVTDGHSLGGGMAQTFAVENGLSGGYGQNSLPIAHGSVASFDSNPTAFGASPGVTFSDLEANWKQTYSFSEVNVLGDPATIFYLGGNYLNASPTSLSNPNLAGELAGILIAALPKDKPFALALTSFDGFHNHSINTVINILASGVASGNPQYMSLLSTDAPTITSATETTTPVESQDTLVGVTDAGVTYDITSNTISTNETDYTISGSGQSSQTIDVVAGAPGAAAELTATTYSGPNNTGPVTGSAVDDSDGTSVITTYTPGGSSVAITYAGPNGTSAATSSTITVTKDDSVIATVNTPNETATFSGGGTLGIADPTAFTGTITNFAQGDTIDLAGISATKAMLTADGKLTVQETGGGTLVLSVPGVPDGQSPIAVPDNDGGTDVELVTAKLITITEFGTFTQETSQGGAIAPPNLVGQSFTFTATFDTRTIVPLPGSGGGLFSFYGTGFTSFSTMGFSASIGSITIGNQNVYSYGISAASGQPALGILVNSAADRAVENGTPEGVNFITILSSATNSGSPIPNPLTSGNFASSITPSLTSFTNGDGITINQSGIAPFVAQGVVTNLTSVTSDAPCYVAGSRVTTERGEMPVEKLAIGDLARTRSDELVPIKWIGHRHVDCSRHPDPRKVWPVRVTAGAFGDGLPRRNLWLSPDHAVFVDDVLIPIRHLINGCTITQEPRDEVAYYHVELDRHDVLLAEGLPAESYLDTGDRSNFENGGGPVRLHPDFSVRMWEAKGCAPLIVTGPILAAVRTRLLQRAAKLAIKTARRRTATRRPRAT